MSQYDFRRLKQQLKDLWTQMDSARANGDFSMVHFLQQKEQRIEALLSQ